MFLFRWLKNIVYIAVIATATLYIADYNVKGKQVRQYVKDAWKSGLIVEGAKDIKTWAVQLFDAGKKVSDNISEKDRKEMEKVIKNELKENISKIKEEADKKQEVTK